MNNDNIIDNTTSDFKVPETTTMVSGEKGNGSDPSRSVEIAPDNEGPEQAPSLVPSSNNAISLKEPNSNNNDNQRTTRTIAETTTTTLVQTKTFSAEDDDMGEVSEVFVDEPEPIRIIESSSSKVTTAQSPTRRGGTGGRRNRANKGSSVTFSNITPTTTKSQKSYWSSDDDSSAIHQQQRAVAPRSRSPKNGKDRGKKSRNKRRTRRVQDNNDHDDSSSDSGPQTALAVGQPPPPPPPPTPLPQRAMPKTNQKPPISVVRTKKTTSSNGIPASISSNQTATTRSNSPIMSSGSGHPVSASAVQRMNSAGTNSGTSPGGPLQHLSIEDMEICQRLDDEYESALEERHIGYMARFVSVRQSACFSVFFMLIFLWLGTYFFMQYADWAMQDSLLFSIYTITTVGYGNQAIPKEMGFQIFTILYIFVGIATLTIMVAQVYQCIALEASRAQHSRDKTEMARRGLGLDVLSRRSGTLQQQRINNNRAHSSQASAASSVTNEPHNINYFEDWACFDTIMHYYEQAKHFFTYNEYGRSFSVLLPFAGLVLIGAVVVGPLEDWSIVESLYFAVVSLTTVGFGDYYPRHTASIWFCIFYLPFSVGFMSMFLKNVATFYIRLSAQNINRIERRMRRRVARAKEQYEFERAEAMKRALHGQANYPETELRRFPSADSDEVQQQTPTKSSASDSSSTARHHNGSPSSAMVGSGRKYGGGRRHNNQFDAVPTTPDDVTNPTPVVKASRASLFGSPSEDVGVLNRRERILKNSLEGNQDDFRPKGQTMDTMKDVIKAVHKSIKSGSSDSRYLSMRSSVMKPVLGDSHQPMRKPSFALRALVQERLAEIIATDIAGFQSSIEIKDNTLSVTIDSLKDTADKWCIPRRARKAFRAVAFEALYFVGEHGLITRGADALYALTPFEFHGLFSPLLAALGDAGTMEEWLASTEVLAEYDLGKKPESEKHLNTDVEMGNGEKRSTGPSTAEKLHNATHRSRPASTDDGIPGVTARNVLPGGAAFA